LKEIPELKAKLKEALEINLAQADPAANDDKTSEILALKQDASNYRALVEDQEVQAARILAERDEAVKRAEKMKQTIEYLQGQLKS
jgi:hypothetical protein